MTDPMSESLDPTEPPEGHNAAEDLDEDRLRLDPLEEGMDPPERWSPAIDHDDAEHRALDERLREEEPERGRRPEPRDEVERMDAAGELSGRPTDEDGEVAFARDLPTAAAEARRGQLADEGDDSVARALRTPSDQPE
jgi:hypothetical protein